MYYFDNQYYLNFGEMMDDIRWEYAHGDREAAMEKLDDLQVSLSGI